MPRQNNVFCFLYNVSFSLSFSLVNLNLKVLEKRVGDAGEVFPNVICWISTDIKLQMYNKSHDKTGIGSIRILDREFLSKFILFSSIKPHISIEKQDCGYSDCLNQLALFLKVCGVIQQIVIWNLMFLLSPHLQTN